MKRVISISVVLALSCIIACSAYANIAAITVSPVTRTMTLSEEGTKEVTYTAHNDSADTIHVKVEPRYWHMTKRDKEMPLGSWLEITPMEFDLEPDEEKEVLCRVTAPKDIRGELATMIAFRPSPQGEQAVNVVFSVSLYAVIKGTEEVSCQVDNFQLRNRKGKDGLETKVVLNNTGNIHIKPRITVYIHDIFDKLLQKAVLAGLYIRVSCRITMVVFMVSV